MSLGMYCLCPVLVLTLHCLLTDHAGVRLTFSNLHIPSLCIADKKHNSGHFPRVLKSLQVLQFLLSLSEGSKETLQLQRVQTLT